jgi:FMN reductase
VLASAAENGASTRLMDLRAIDLPMFRPGARPNVPGLVEAQESIHWADAIVLATPDYHGSMSGALKNFLDYFWKEYAGKLFGYLCASHEKGLTAMDQMRTVVRQCYGWSLPYGVSINGDEELNPTGESEAIQKRLRMLGRDIAVYGAVLREQFHKDLAGGVQETFVAKYRKS